LVLVINDSELSSIQSIVLQTPAAWQEPAAARMRRVEGSASLDIIFLDFIFFLVLVYFD
jgi:hypothetical protein